MTKAPISLQDLRRRLYVKAKAEPTWRFWGLYVHVCKMETLREAYRLAKANDGAPGIDGVTFEAIEAEGVEGFLEQLRERAGTAHISAASGTRRKEIPKDGGKVRVLSIPCDPGPGGPGSAEADPGTDLRGRLPTGVVWLPAEADSACSGPPGGPSDCSEGKTHVIDIDLRAYFDNVRHRSAAWRRWRGG